MEVLIFILTIVLFTALSYISSKVDWKYQTEDLRNLIYRTKESCFENN